LAEERKIIGQSEIFGRIDIGTDEFHLGWLSAMSQVSLPNAEAVDELVGFDPGLPSSNPALSILKRPVFRAFSYRVGGLRREAAIKGEGRRRSYATPRRVYL